MPTKQQTVDDYLAHCTPEHRTVLMALRKTILALVPGAEEVISYGVPTIRFEKKMLIGFGASAKHCALYPLNPKVMTGLHNEFKDFVVTKGSIQFTPDQPLPELAVHKLVRARIRDNRQITKAKKSKDSKRNH